MKTLLKNCLLSNLKKVNILMINGKINRISEFEISEDNDIKFDAVFDIKNNLVMPGIIDSFSKMKLDTPYSCVSYNSESISCAYGGITNTICYLDICNNLNFYKNFVDNDKEIKKQSIVNYGFIFAPNNKISTKDFIRSQSWSLGSILFLDKEDLLNKEAIVFWTMIINNSRLIMLNLSGIKIDQFFSFYKNLDKKIIFYDVMNENDLNRILFYKDKGYDIVVATSINHLLLNREHLNSEYKKKTLLLDKPLGSIINNISLWNAIRDGKIDIITSNHTPVSLIEKFENLTPGLPGFETFFSLLFDNFHFKKIPLVALEKILCLNPAISFGLKNKGKIEEGYDADLIVVNTTKRWWIKNEDIVSSARWTPYNDYKINGKVMMTFVNGELVFNWINQMKPIRDVLPGASIVFNKHIKNKIDLKTYK